ncbi:MAG: radical SAM protein [Desulfobacteraceae bacterium]|nr:radical SAM protein [Desulfobacteraceae bacterium]MBC2757499.1 radical SAM protein [Desulfobacteraceae bacterium]
MSKTVAFSKHSVNVFFHILTQCNLKCCHCYINRDQHGNNTLSVETICAWLNLFVNKTQNANLIFLGGEPTLHPGLDKGVKAAREMGYSSITIDTNGYLFHDILNKIAPADIDFLSFSLDGATPKTNDRIRGNGCYEQCVSGIQNAVTSGFKTSLIFTVSNENIHELHMMPALLSRLGVDRFFIQVIGIRGKSRGKPAGTDNDRLQVDRGTWMSLIPSVADQAADLGITVTYPKVFLNDADIFECAGRVAENYFIFPNGRVYRCPLCEDYPLHSFEIKDNTLIPREKINEQDLFALNIAEGCVMNKLVQSGNLSYREDGTPDYKIACCLLKEEVPARNS